MGVKGSDHDFIRSPVWITRLHFTLQLKLQKTYLYIINYEILRKHMSAARRQHGHPKTEKGYK